MKKPKIKIEEIGFYGPNVLEMKIGKNITIYCRKWAEAQLIEEMIDALINAHTDMKISKKSFIKEFLPGSVRYANKRMGEIEKVLQKVGVEL